MPSVDKIKVPRYLLHGLDLLSIAKIEVHGFADSSQKACGSAVYLCAEDQNQNRVSSLVMAKSRVAPMKRVTLPRLELLAAFITAKLLHYVVQTLRISVDSVYTWSEGRIVKSLQQRFWLPQGRRELKRVLKKCLTCKHWNTQPCQQKMAPLPVERVMIAPLFSNIGLYFTGLLHLKVEGNSKSTTRKVYVCIFICEDTRAVQLELLNSMTRGLSNTHELSRVVKRPPQPV